MLSGRLLAVLTREMEALERLSEENDPTTGLARKPITRKAKASVPADIDETIVARPPDAIGAKARIEAVGQMTRTLEKLLDLQRLEALASRAAEGSDDDGEADRLRAEMMKRLQNLDRRRHGGPGLFREDGNLVGARNGVGEAGSPVPGADAVA